MDENKMEKIVMIVFSYLWTFVLGTAIAQGNIPTPTEHTIAFGFFTFFTLIWFISIIGVICEMLGSK